MDTRSQATMSHFPLFADLRGRAVLVVGGGAVAARKVALLGRAGARILLVARELDPALGALVAASQASWLARDFRPEQLEGCWLAVAATDDAVVNASVAAAAREHRLPVNVVDDPVLSTVIVPAIVDRAPLLVAISTGGAAPVVARRLRAEIEVLIDGSWAALASLCAAWRRRIVAAIPGVDDRRRFYEWLVDGPVRSSLRAGRQGEADASLRAALAAPAATAGAAGRVALVGAGPGDPGLLTLNALRALQAADVILHDQLVTGEVLDLARRDALRVAVGKQAGGHTTPQSRINALMVEHARAGRVVVRLKGGDPFMFGRGGEELEYLRAHDVPYEVVPGITAATACAAYAGIPLTHRDHAQSVRFITAHCRDSLDTLDWPCLARERQTLAVYMGVATAPELQRKLVAHGRAATTPVAVVENGSRPTQRVVSGTLGELAALMVRHQVRSPALLVIGEVAALADSLAWFAVPQAPPSAPRDLEPVLLPAPMPARLAAAR